MSGVRSLVKVAGAALAAHGATKTAAIVNGEDVLGVCLVLAGFIWSHYAHKEVKP